MFKEKVRVAFQISRPANIPQKWFITQNEPLDVRFQMRLTQTSFHQKKIGSVISDLMTTKCDIWRHF